MEQAVAATPGLEEMESTSVEGTADVTLRFGWGVDIDAAANEAARIESLCKTLGVAVLASDRVVEHMGSNWRSLGDQELRGVADKIEVFTPDITSPNPKLFS